MWSILKASGGIVAVLIALYFFFFIKRIILFFFPNAKKSVYYSVSAALGLIIGVLCSDVFDFPAVFVLHIMVFSLLARLIDLAVKRIAKEKYDRARIWHILYKSGAIALAFTVAMTVGGYINLHNIVATEYTVTTQKTIRSEGYRVVLLSDIHYGVSVEDEEFQAVCDEISAQNPDFVVLCGDIVDNHTTRDQMFFVFEALGSIKSEYGIFYNHGNHDRPYGFAGFGSEFSEAELISAMEDNGIKILCDEVFEINGEILLVGREDRSVRSRKTVASLLEGKDTDKYVIALDHQPREYTETAATATDLVLSGHTHGGQIWPIGQVQEIFNMNDEVYGHGFIDEDTQYIVSSGVAGWRYPIKTAAPAEYVVIDIKSK